MLGKFSLIYEILYQLNIPHFIGFLTKSWSIFIEIAPVKLFKLLVAGLKKDEAVSNFGC